MIKIKIKRKKNSSSVPVRVSATDVTEEELGGAAFRFDDERGIVLAQTEPLDSTDDEKPKQLQF